MKRKRKNYSMFWNWVYWQCDCDQMKTVFQFLKLVDIVNIKSV